MIKCLAVDDEAYALEIIANYIERIPDLTLVSKCTSAVEALEWVKKGHVDLVFLDIQMHELSGIDFLRICGTQVKVILTTAYDQYAVEGFELNALDYLMKPISYPRFLKSVEKAQQVLALEERAGSIESAESNHLFIKGSGKNEHIKIHLNNLLYIEGLKNYVSIYTLDGRFVTYQSLRSLEAILPSSMFLRIHKSYIVAMQHITKVESKKVWVSEMGLPISETYQKSFLQAFEKTMLLK